MLPYNEESPRGPMVVGLISKYEGLVCRDNSIRVMEIGTSI